MERTLDSYSVTELKDYIRGLYAIPRGQFTGEDRLNLKEAVQVLDSKGYQHILRSGERVVFGRKPK